MKFIKNILRKINIRNNYIATEYPEEDKEISIDLVNHLDRPKVSHLVDNNLKGLPPDAFEPIDKKIKW